MKLCKSDFIVFLFFFKSEMAYYVPNFGGGHVSVVLDISELWVLIQKHLKVLK